MQGRPAGYFRQIRIAIFAALSIGLISLIGPGDRAAAQTLPSDPRERQAVLFEALADDPANLELMFAYAVTSILAEDYEAAISTLERMLFYNPDLSRVKLELAVAYYRLGVYEVARVHFESVLNDDPPQEVVDRVQPFLNEIEGRTAVHALSGSAEVGMVYSTNANLGPPGREVQVEFFPGGVGVLSEDEDEAPDFGVRFRATGVHRYDLRQANDNAWITSVDYTGVHYAEEKDGDLDAFLVSTGPQLALDDEAFGRKARPNVGMAYVRSAGEALYLSGIGGLEVTETFTPLVSGFASASAEWREFFNGRDDFTGVYGAAFVGASITPDRNQSYGVALLTRTDRTEAPFNRNNEFGFRVSANRSVDLSELTDFFLFERPWRFTVFGQGSVRYFDEPDPAVDVDQKRRDQDVRFGGRVLAPLDSDIAMTADVSYFHRFSNIRNFELRNLEVIFSVVHVF